MPGLPSSLVEALSRGFVAVLGEELCCPAEVEALLRAAQGKAIDPEAVKRKCLGYSYPGYRELVRLADMGYARRIFYICPNDLLRRELPRIAQPIYGNLEVLASQGPVSVSKHRADEAYLEASIAGAVLVLGLERPWSVAFGMAVVAWLYGSPVYLVARRSSLPRRVFTEIVEMDPADFLRRALDIIGGARGS